MTNQEQPYERLLNDGAKLVGYEIDGYVLFGSFLFWLFGPGVLLYAIFGHVWGWVYWVLFFAAFPMALLTLAWVGSSSERYSRRGP